MLSSACSVAHTDCLGLAQLGQTELSSKAACTWPSVLGARASMAPDWLGAGCGPQLLGCRAVLPLSACVLLASDWLIMCVIYIKRTGMCPRAHLYVTH